MMLLPKRILIVSIAASSAMATTESTQAGQWLDSILGRNQPIYSVGSPVPVAAQTAYSPGAGYVPTSYAPYAGSQLSGGYANTAYPSVPALTAQTLGYGAYNTNQPPTTNAALLAPGFPQTVAGTLPTAAYDTRWGQVPVTYYRPVTAFDPRYGTTVTSLQPCTSYQYQAQRPPVIAPRALLGPYGAQANTWPGITGPGYNPTGLAMTSGYAPTLQTIPNSGVPMSVMNPLAPVVSSGSSTGMPATSFPTRTMGAPYAANFAGPTWPVAANGSNVVPTAAWMPANSSANCANGTCVQPPMLNSGMYAPGNFSAAGGLSPIGNVANPGMVAPNIPGATVTPVGQPTYSSTPSAVGNTWGGSNPAMPNSTVPNPTLPNSNFAPPSTGGQIFPNQQVWPGQPNTGLGDPEATRVPGIGDSSASAAPATDLQRLPMVAIDQNRNRSVPVPQTGAPQTEASAAFRPSPEVSNAFNAPSSNAPSQMMKSATIPSTLPDQPYTGMKPLTAPADFDGKPKWNPSLLDPDDRTVWEQNNLKNASPIQLVSGVGPKNEGVVQAVSTVESVREGAGKSGFRPVTALQ